MSLGNLELFSSDLDTILGLFFEHHGTTGKSRLPSLQGKSRTVDTTARFSVPFPRKALRFLYTSSGDESAESAPQPSEPCPKPADTIQKADESAESARYSPITRLRSPQYKMLKKLDGEVSSSEPERSPPAESALSNG